MSEENQNPSAPADSAPPYRRRRPSRRRPQRRRSNGARSENSGSDANANEQSRADGSDNLREDRTDEAALRREDAAQFADVAHDSGENQPREDDRDRPEGSGQNGAELPREPEFGDGIIEISGKGFGFLRDAKRNFVQTPNDIFVTPEIVRRFQLRDGMWIHGEIRKGNRGPQLTRLLKINDEEPTKYQDLRPFEELTTINPNSRIKLETVPDRYTTRIMDLMTPLGKGQRGLIVAPPRTGKTTLLQHIADAVVKNHPEMKLIILLVDERPEEVTEIRRTVPSAELMASSNDSDIKSHTRIAQLAVERAKRLVEAGKDVFILLDSITRTARAFNNATGGGGRTMSGGIDARAMEIPRKLFAAARNTEEAG
ncbi:MAG: transcription termination factor Rho, partial [Chthoniobacterales bacterium]